MPRYRGWKNFNPRTPCGVRPQRGLVLVKVPPFQSTHPLRGATRLPPLWPRQATFQSTHPLRGATRGGAGDILHGGISIHAPLAGCDSSQAAKGRAPANFNPRTPCGVRRHRRQGNQSARGFQSTHPLRGATRKMRARMRAKNFNPRTPCGVRLLLLSSGCLPSYFNPRTPCGVRHYSIAQSAWQENFNPRTPCGVRLVAALVAAGEDYFNPRTPCGVRPLCNDRNDSNDIFQSTHPLRGATVGLQQQPGHIAFQSTHPLRGATTYFIRMSRVLEKFQSTHPLRGATPCSKPFHLLLLNFNPRTPCGVRRRAAASWAADLCISIHAPLAGCDVTGLHKALNAF